MISHAQDYSLIYKTKITPPSLQDSYKIYKWMGSVADAMDMNIST